MSQIINAAPFANLLGIDDQSKRAVPYESTTVPIHLPHVFSYAAWGPDTPQLVVGSTAINTYGQATFEPRGAYVTHQWPLIDRMMNRSNAIVYHRIRPDDAPDPATIGLYLDVLEAQVVQYKRNSDGTFEYDSGGNRIPTGSKVPGYRLKWVIGPCVDGKLGKAKRVPGSQTGTDNKTSTIYPIVELQTSFFGDGGNNRGLRLWAPTMDSDNPVNGRVVEDQLAQLYRIQFVQRNNNRSTGTVIRTLGGAEYVDFAFRDDVVDQQTGVEFGFDLTVLDGYRDLSGRSGQPRKWGPFNASYLYEDNLGELLEMLQAAEAEVNDTIVTGTPGSEYMINFVDGIHYDGVPYHAIEVLGPNDAASNLSQTATYYAEGGGDGTMSKELFDTAVGQICAEYGDGPFNLTDSAKFPQSIIYDTGYRTEVKYQLFGALSARKDIAVIASTQDVGLPQNTAQQESSMAVGLQTQASLHPESEYYGTPVCRAAIVGHSGYLISSKYRNLVPLTVDLADKLAAYGGSGTGVLTPGNAPDVNPNNLVTLLKDLNCTFKPARVRNTDWDNGLIWIQSFDQDDAMFYPALQTVYNNDTSVLNSVLTMLICVELEKVCDRVWRHLTGRSDLTNDQFIQRSNELIQEFTERRFDNRVVIVPETYYTGMDLARGYSWSCKIKMYANNMKTVGTFTIEAHRREELDQ